MARAFNLALGGAVVAPWELGDLDEAHFSALWRLSYELPGMREATQYIEQVKADYRNALKRKH